MRCKLCLTTDAKGKNKPFREMKVAATATAADPKDKTKMLVNTSYVCPDCGSIQTETTSKPAPKPAESAD